MSEIGIISIVLCVTLPVSIFISGWINRKAIERAFDYMESSATVGGQPIDTHRAQVEAQIQERQRKIMEREEALSNIGPRQVLQ